MKNLFFLLECVLLLLVVGFTAVSTTSWNNRILGDATGEMGPFYYYEDMDGIKKYHNNWYADHSYFVDSTAP